MSDFTLESTVYKTFTTRSFTTGVPTVLAGSPVVSAYENDSVTQITAGITLGVDHDGVVGLNLLTIVATAANGYEAGKHYNLVITTGTVGGVSVVGETVWYFTLGESAAFDRLGAPAGASVSADVAAVKVDTAAIKAKTDSLTFTVAGVADANVTHFGGTAGTFADGMPDVDVERVDGVANAATALASYWGQAATTGTADSGTTTTMVDAALTQADADWWKGSWIVFRSGTLAGQARLITAFDAGTDTVTFAPATTAAVSTHTYVILPAGAIDVGMWLNTIAATPTVAGVPEVDLTHVNGAAQTATLDTIKAETASILDDTDLIDDATSGLAKIATDAAAILVDTAVIGALGAGLTAVPWNAAWDAEVQSEVADALAVSVDGQLTAVKAKTDSLTFTVAGSVDANIQHVNDTAVTGAGVVGNTWGP